MITRIYHVECDFCGHADEVETESKADARRQMREKGWRFKGREAASCELTACRGALAEVNG